MFEGSSAAAVQGVGGDADDRDQQQGGRLAWRYATQRDVCEFYGRLPAETLRAAVITLGGAVVGIVGIARGGGVVRLFSEHKPELVPYLSSVTVWRAVKAALRFVDECSSAVYVVSSDESMMRRLGFQPVPGAEGLWQS